MDNSKNDKERFLNRCKYLLAQRKYGDMILPADLYFFTKMDPALATYFLAAKENLEQAYHYMANKINPHNS